MEVCMVLCKCHSTQARKTDMLGKERRKSCHLYYKQGFHWPDWWWPWEWGRGGRGAGAEPRLDGRGFKLWEGTDVVRAGTEDDVDKDELDELADTEGGVGLAPTGDEVLTGVGELRGTERRALTAKRWSLLDMSELTVSSRRTFSCLSWCRQDNSDATEERHMIIFHNSIP